MWLSVLWVSSLGQADLSHAALLVFVDLGWHCELSYVTIPPPPTSSPQIHMLKCKPPSTLECHYIWR